MNKITLTITEKQAFLILKALENESNDDAVEFGEYSYARCYNDIKKKIDKQYNL